MPPARDGVWISSGTKIRNSILEFNFRQDFLTEVRGLALPVLSLPGWMTLEF